MNNKISTARTLAYLSLITSLLTSVIGIILGVISLHVLNGIKPSSKQEASEIKRAVGIAKWGIGIGIAIPILGLVIGFLAI
jgi:hypothetical protein